MIKLFNKKLNLQNSNIMISGWPSSGGSTQARLLVLIFDFNYIYAGGVLKYWVDAMGYNSRSNDINTWADKYHADWDYVWENYIAKKIKTARHTLFEGKTAGFLVNDNNIYKIFIQASLEARTNRSRSDSRQEEIQKRDKFLQKEWMNRFNIDIFDQNLINKKYDLVLDTSEIGIRETAEIILNSLEKNFGNFDNNIFLEKLENLMKEYEKNSNYLLDQIKSKGLILEPQNIFKEIKSHYPELIENINTEMKVVFD